MRRLCLLVGAGFSYDAGLPLVTSLTKRFVKLALNPIFVGKLLAKYPREVVESASAVVSQKNLTYEDMLGWLQTAQHHPENHKHYQEYGWIKTTFTDAVYLILLIDQIKSHRIRNDWIAKYAGFEKLAQKHKPLRVFSLNHDLVVEDVCEHFNISLHDGFTGDRKVEFLTKKANKTPFAIFTVEDMKKGKLNLLNEGELGVNLYKIHGGIDYFALRDRTQLARVAMGSVEKNLEALNRLSVPNNDGGDVIGETVVEDEMGEIQFLRRVHIAGTYKFNSRFPQNQSEEWLKRFSQDINYAEDLVSIGYSFGDAHINLSIRNWLEHNGSRMLQIVNPFSDEVPLGFRHFWKQVKPIKKTASDFLLSL